MSSSPILKINGLTKYYSRHPAVDNLSLEVQRGEIFGFLGPNGAGKTTTLNMLVGITKPSAGNIEIFGRRFCSGDIEPLERIGYVPESTFLPDYFSLIELLDFYAQIFGLPQNVKKERIKQLLDIVGVFNERHTLIKNLSMGQRRLVDFMQALINEPDLILLDEPTVYLDPIIMERFRSILLYLKKEGRTIIISSQMLSEIEKVSDRVAIIYKGRLLKLGASQDFMHGTTMEEEFLRIVKDADQKNI